MKGMELPISTVVIVAVAVLVMVVVSAFFLSQSGYQFGEIDTRSRFSQLCTTMKCTVEQSRKIADDSDFYKTCQELYGASIQKIYCLQACGCKIEIGQPTAENVEEDIRNLASDPFFTNPTV